MAFCPNCGSANEEGDPFCFGCGHRLDEPAAPQPPPVAPQPPHAVQQPPPSAPQPPPIAPRTPGGLPRGLLIGIGIAAVAMVAVLGVVLATSGEEATSASSAPIVTTTPTTAVSGTQTPSASSASPSAPPTESVVPSVGALVLGSTCTNDLYGYQIGFPQGWYASEGSEFGCQFFDPAPLDITANTEVVGIAVGIILPYDRYGRTVSSFEDPFSSNLVSLNQTTVGGLDATVLETEATGNGFFLQGTMTYAYIVNLGGYGLAISTSGMPGAVYETNKQAIDLMVGSMSFFA